jgi:D-3-phosphoglycerate dehydrogenase
MNYKVVVTDYVFPNLEIEKLELGKIGAELVECRSSDPQTIIREAADADAVLTCYAELTPKVIESFDKCRIISRYGIGVNNIHVPSATKKGIPVTYVPDYCIEEVSDHALALILACARKICQLNQIVKGGIWDFKGHRPLYRLRGQKLGLVGFGKISRRLVEKVRAFEFTILAHDPYVSKKTATEYQARLVGFVELLKESDIVSIHAPLTKETEGMFGYEQFSMMKNTALLINTARGKLINEQDLARALEQGLIAGAGLDLLANEAFDPDNPLFKLENVIITPHVAFYSEQSVRELQYKAVQEVVRILTGQAPVACLNPEVLNK